MKNYTLTLIDTTGLQNYIFGSNRMRENIGASALVEQVTRLWSCQCVQLVAGSSHNIQSIGRFEASFDPTRTIEGNGLKAEVIFTGGGNAAILFASAALARSFAADYSKRLLFEAPGLDVAIHHQDEIVWDDPKDEKSLRQSWNKAVKSLARKKTMRTPSLPLLGLSVSATCESSDLPAVSYDEFNRSKVKVERRSWRVVGQMIQAKVGGELNEWSRDRLKDLHNAFRYYGVPYDYDKGLEAFREDDAEEGHYVAIVHADGNGMGKRFIQVFDNAASDRDAVKRVRTLSTTVDAIGKSALQQMIAKLYQYCENNPELRKQEFLPLRPLVFGGDDLTFLCEGKLGLSLAAAYLNAFEAAGQQHQKTLDFLPQELRTFYACAGIAIVKSHYPFSRAYQLSEELCKSAKARIRQIEESDADYDASALDWHFAATGLLGELDEIREREFCTRSGKLYARPLLLKQNQKDSHDWRNWTNFLKAHNEFCKGKEWKDKRNKMIQLREALRNGPDAVERYLRSFSLANLPELNGNKSIQEKGWDGDRCGYFDAIEAIDFVVQIEQRDSGGAKQEADA